MERNLNCPSAQPQMAGASVFGVIQGTATEPRVGYLEAQLPLDERIVALAQPVEPTEVFRIAAPCAGTCCQHFADRRCQLVTRLVNILQPVETSAPPCALRSTCMWWQQEGVAACLRCPQIVTRMFGASDTLREAAAPVGLGVADGPAIRRTSVAED